MTARRGEPALEVLQGDPQRKDREPQAQGEAAPSLREWLDIVADGRWIIGVAVGLAVAAAAAYLLVATPVFRTDALIQLEEKRGANKLLGDLAGVLSEQSVADTEIEVLRSRAMIGAAVRELSLDIEAAPRRFPLIGAAVARRSATGELTGPFLGRRYAWGGETVDLTRIQVPDRLMGRLLTLVAGDGGRYTLIGPDDDRILEGEVGKLASGGGVEVLVSELRAGPGVEFVVGRRWHDDVVREFQERIKITEKGKKTGVLQLSLQGNSPRKISAIVDALARAYVKQNVDRLGAEAEKALVFLQGQLPTLRANLDAAEAELERYRSRRGSVDVSLETQAVLGRVVDLEKALAALRVERAALRERFTEEHPGYVALIQKIKSLEDERATIEGTLRRLPQSELESARRMRDVKVANELYLMVLNKAQELQVVKEGTIGTVRVIDTANVPVRPVSPKKALTLGLAVILGALAGALGAFLRSAFANGAEDPDAIERATSLPVSACVPHSTSQQDAERGGQGGTQQSRPLLAAVDPKDLAVESLRSLRTSLQFALAETRKQIVAIGGPAPAVGKSFVTANLAHLLGEAGKRIVVIDADLRRGQLHRHFGLERGVGLSDAIAGDVAAADAIRPTQSPNVSVLTTGRIPSNPAELLGSERFQRLLADLATRFDIVLVDTPPVLAVTDAALVARHAGVTFLVIRARKHPMREILASLRQFSRNGVRVHGIVVNDLRLDRGLGRRNAYHYQYDYN